MREVNEWLVGCISIVIILVTLIVCVTFYYYNIEKRFIEGGYSQALSGSGHYWVKVEHPHLLESLEGAK